MHRAQTMHTPWTCHAHGMHTHAPTPAPLGTPHLPAGGSHRGRIQPWAVPRRSLPRCSQPGPQAARPQGPAPAHGPVGSGTRSPRACTHGVPGWDPPLPVLRWVLGAPAPPEQLFGCSLGACEAAGCCPASCAGGWLCTPTDTRCLPGTPARCGCSVPPRCTRLLHSHTAHLHCTLTLHPHTAPLHCTATLHTYNVHPHCTPPHCTPALHSYLAPLHRARVLLCTPTPTGMHAHAAFKCCTHAAHTRKCTRTCTHTHTHTDVHMCMHTHTHTYTCTLRLWVPHGRRGAPSLHTGGEAPGAGEREGGRDGGMEGGGMEKGRREGGRKAGWREEGWRMDVSQAAQRKDGRW